MRMRLSFLYAALVLLLAVVLFGPQGTEPGGAAATRAAARPNIVFVLTDDLSDNLVRYLPSVLQLKKDGSSLSHYFVVDSLCCPSRTAILTGEYPHDDGGYTNVGTYGGYGSFMRHRDQTKTFAVRSQAANYRTALMGKYLNGYRVSDPPAPGWSEWDVVDRGYSEFNYPMPTKSGITRYGDAPADYLTDVLRRKAVQFIDKSAAARQPFFLEVAAFAPPQAGDPGASLPRREPRRRPAGNAGVQYTAEQCSLMAARKGRAYQPGADPSALAIRAPGPRRVGRR